MAEILRRLIVVLTAIWLIAAASVQAAEVVLLADDFAKTGPLDTRVKWQAEKAPHCEGSQVLTAPGAAAGFQSRKTFGEPISVEFKQVWMTQSHTPSDNNNIGITPGHSRDMIFFRFAKGNLYAVRKLKGNVYGEPDKLSPGGWGIHVGKIETAAKGGRRSVPYDLRIDWWPGKLVRFYVNGRKIGDYFDHVMDTPMPIGVRDESAYFRIGGIKVTRLADDIEGILAEKARAEEAARRAVEESRRAKEAAMQARVSRRVQGLAKQFPRKLRLVIGGPCYFWGIDPVIKTDLEQAGMEVLAWPDAPLLDPEQSHVMGSNPMLYNVIIFGDPFYHLIQPDPNTGEIPERIRRQVPLLRRFLKAGGGIWFCGLGEQNWGRSSHALNYILKELDLDAEVVGEVVKDSQAFKGAPSRFPWYAWTDVLKDPLTTGVENLLTPSGVVSGEGSMGVCPILRVGRAWRVLVKGKPSAASYPVVPGAAEGRLQDTPRTVKASPLLCAVRQAGKGRVVLWPTWTNFTVTGGSGGPVLDGERDGEFSEGARLIENLLCWLAEPSQGSKAVGVFDPARVKPFKRDVNVDAKLRAWRKPGRKDYPRQFKGLIGAHSSLSDGKSSPQAMIAAAKKAGYDFIAFTEDLARMDAGKWQRLLAACDAANKRDPSIVAYPGIDFMDEAGNRGLHFGNRYWIKDEWRSKDDRSRIRWWYNLAYQADADAHRWAPRVIIRSRTNKKRPWNQGLWNLFGAFCYEGGKLVDDSFHEWRRLIGPNVFFLNTGLLAVHSVRSAEEIAAAARPGLYQAWVKADNLAQVLSRMSGCTGPAFMGCFPTYVSAGPKIEDFRCYCAVLRGEISYDLAVPGNDHGWLHVLARSDVGLKSVEVYDGTRLFRRFLPGGKKRFEAFITVLGDSSHCYSTTVTDQRDRKAHGWNAFLQVHEKVHRRCGDNWNWMTTGKGPGRLGTPEFTYQLHEVTAGWPTRRPGAETKPRRSSYLCEQGMYGHGGLSGAINGYIRGGGLVVDGKPWPKGYPAPAMTLNFETTGRYGIILTTTVRDEQLIPKLEPYTIGAFSGPYKVRPAPWPADLRQFAPMQKPGGATINRYQGKVRFVRNVAAPGGGKTITLGLGATGKPRATTVEIMNPDGTSVRREGSGETIRGDVPQGGYICWYDDKGDGVGGVIALSPGVRYSYNTGWQACHVNVPSPATPGTEATWDVIFVTGNRSTGNSNAQMEAVRVGMGIAGKPALYDVHPQYGKVVGWKYFLTLEAEGGGFRGKVVKSTEKQLPIHLPVMVRGLNRRWSALIWYRGNTRLHTVDSFRDKFGVQTWRWQIARYEPRLDEVRPIPILDGGVGYCQVDTDKQDPDVFIGNPIVCDQPDVFITVIKAEKGKCKFEINNPTDKTVTCTVRPAKGFDLTGKWRKTLMLPAGGFETVSVIAANARDASDKR